ncbi:papain fold toxin domain-containing protein [Microseira sp. BLCC-F43]|uniref:papain fold toxin domain-containing protein n=1 Tax=Microseira sp. BLCC-F43 TaxID=3153602 RepID=UPI0035B8C686
MSSGFANFYCVECEQASEHYLVIQGIRGKRIKLYTGAAIKPNKYIWRRCYRFLICCLNSFKQFKLSNSLFCLFD